MSLNPNLEMRNVTMAGERVKATCPNCKIRLVGDECPKCDYKRVKGYDVKPDTDMSVYGFAKEVTFKHLDVDPAKETITVTEVDYWAKDFKCGACDTDLFVWLFAQRTGVTKSCIRCQMTTGILSQEFGRAQKPYKISAQEALKILEGYSATKNMLKPVQKILFGKKFIPKRRRPKPK